MTLNPQDYTGHVTAPGKFEGEARATLYYYELIMNGDGEDITPQHSDGEPVSEGLSLVRFVVDGEEAAAFGKDAQIECGDIVIILEDGLGFVSMLAFASDDAAEHWMYEWFGQPCKGCLACA